MTNEIQLLRELGGEVPAADQALIRDIYARATRSERTFVRRWLDSRLGQPRYAAAVIAVTAAATAAIALPIVFGSNAVKQGSSTRVSTPPRSTVGGKLVQNAASVSDLNAANALLPFTAVFPSSVTPTGIQVDTSGQISTSGLPTAPAFGLTAHFDTTDVGSYMLSEWTAPATLTTAQQTLQVPVTSLQEWAYENCTDCTPQVVTEDGVPVEVLASPVIGLHLYWIRGDGTSSPVATELDWSTDMPANNVIPSQQAALAIAGDIISQGG